MGKCIKLTARNLKAKLSVLHTLKMQILIPEYCKNTNAAKIYLMNIWQLLETNKPAIIRTRK